MEPLTGVTGIAHVIQLAVAPVFLLTGIGALLSVLTGRLARIIDRARVLETGFPALPEPERRERESELKTLCVRAGYINHAIRLVTMAELLVCAVIAALFLGEFFEIDMSTLVGIVFIASMAFLIVGLFIFLSEVHLATRTLRIGASAPSKGI